MRNATLDNGKGSKLILLCVNLFLVLQTVGKSLNFELKLTPNQDLCHARSIIKDGESGICRIKWRTDARDSPILIPERARNKSLLDHYKRRFSIFLLTKNTRNKLTPNYNLFQAPSSITRGVSRIKVFTCIDKPFFPPFRKFSNAYLTLNIHISVK